MFLRIEARPRVRGDAEVTPRLESSRTQRHREGPSALPKDGQLVTSAIWDTERVIAFTVDLDWASEAAIRCAQTTLDRYELSATYFVTHPSEFVAHLEQAGRAEVGIHPNFLAGSTHGNTFSEVIDYCLRLAPAARCFRSHRYFDVSDITHALYAHGYRYDSNVCSFLAKGLRPFRHESGLVRFPTFFEDGTYLYHHQTLRFADARDKLFAKPGLMVLSFHPTDLALNAPDLGWLRDQKDRRTRSEWNALSAEALSTARHRGLGVADFVEDMFAYIRSVDVSIHSLSSLYRLYCEWEESDGGA